MVKVYDVGGERESQEAEEKPATQPVQTVAPTPTPSPDQVYEYVGVPITVGQVQEALSYAEQIIQQSAASSPVTEPVSTPTPEIYEYVGEPIYVSQVVEAQAYAQELIAAAPVVEPIVEPVVAKGETVSVPEIYEYVGTPITLSQVEEAQALAEQLIKEPTPVEVYQNLQKIQDIQESFVYSGQMGLKLEEIGRYAEWYANAEENLKKIMDIQTAFSYSGQLGLQLPEIGRYAEYFAYRSEFAKSIEDIQKAFTYSGQYGLKLEEIHEYAEAFAESSYFWRTAGYPEFAGRYMPVTVPEGYKISSVKETVSGLEVSFEPIISMEHVIKGLEKNFGVSVGSAKALTLDEYRDVYRGFAKEVEQVGYKSVEEFRLAASILAAVSIPYASLHVGLPFVTLKGFLTNVALGVGLNQAIVGITEKRWITPLEAAATAAYTELAYIGTSALFHYVITPKAAEWLTTRYWQRASEALSTGQTPGLTRFEKAVSFLTGAKPYVPPQVVVIPEFAKPTATDIYKQMQAWELAVAPKSTALLLSEMTSPVPTQTSRVAAWVSEHWLKRVTGG
ncbi:MAG: hypothetical protein QXH87_04155, partial [Candidatus Bathyarchaeia archaeon]